MKTLGIEELDLTPVRMGWDIPPHVNRTVKGTPLSIAGQAFRRGIWMNAPCRIPLKLDGKAVRLRCGYGHEDLVQSQAYPAPRLRFTVEVDGVNRFDSGWVASGDQAGSLEVGLTGATRLVLGIEPENGQVGNAQGDWLEPDIEYLGEQPVLELGPEGAGDDGLPGKGYTAFHPGKRWYDTDGVPIQAHGGGLLEVEGRYYLYGEHKGGSTSFWPKSRVDVIGVGVYSSSDLLNWKNEGIVLTAQPEDPSSPLHPSNVLERPKVLYNPLTRKYVVWVKSEDAHYTWGRALVAEADHPTGPFGIVAWERPWLDRKFGDFALYQEGHDAWIVIATGVEEVLYIYKLSPDYRSVVEETGSAYQGIKREAPALFKVGETYYLVSSGKSGWAPNPTRYATAGNLSGPWEDRGLLFEGDTGQNSFRSQPTFVLSHRDRYIYMGDRWNQRDLGDSRYIWLPLEFIGGRLSVKWMERWAP